MTKYKNIQGLSLNYTGHKNDIHAQLVKEVVAKAISMLRIAYLEGNKWDTVREVCEYLDENFSLDFPFDWDIDMRLKELGDCDVYKTLYPEAE